MIYILGDGGHARVVADVIASIGNEWTMISRDLEQEWSQGAAGSYIAIGIGMAKHRADICQSLLYRYTVTQKYVARDFGLPCLTHRQAIVRNQRFGHGVQIMAGAIVQIGTWIEDAAIINTGAQVDHDCIIGMGAHIAPGAVICGGCKIGSCTLIGANATVLPGIKIAPHSVVPAGEVVRRNI